MKHYEKSEVCTPPRIPHLCFIQEANNLEGRLIISIFRKVEIEATQGFVMEQTQAR